jgi:hypothetical protein
MIYISNFKYSYISVISVAKLKNNVVFVFTYVLESLALSYGDFGMNSYSVDSYDAMKRGDKALNVSSLQFLV